MRRGNFSIPSLDVFCWAVTLITTVDVGGQDIDRRCIPAVGRQCTGMTDHSLAILTSAPSCWG